LVLPVTWAADKYLISTKQADTLAQSGALPIERPRCYGSVAAWRLQGQQ